MSQTDPAQQSPQTVGRIRRWQRHLRLQKFGYRDYCTYLRSAHWHSVKARYRVSDQPQDCICGEAEAIQLHHMTYERVGEELLTDLTPLCPTCHAMIHTLEARGEIGLDFSGFCNEERAARHRAEVEAERQRREINIAHDLAGMEDVLRMASDLIPMAKALPLSSRERGKHAHDAYIVASATKTLVRKLTVMADHGYLSGA